MTTTMPGAILHKLRRSLRGQEEAGLTDRQPLGSFLAGRDAAFEALVRQHATATIRASKLNRLPRAPG